MADGLRRALQKFADGVHAPGEPSAALDADLPAGLLAVYQEMDGAELYHGDLVLHPRLEWRRDAYEERPDPELGTIRVHPFFEGMLVRNERVIAPDGQIKWIITTAGGARTNYEAATLRVLHHIANADPTFKGLIEDATLKHLGLRSGQKGRPRKVA